MDKAQMITKNTAIGPYSPARTVSVNGGALVFISGQIPLLHPVSGRIVSTNFSTQARQVLTNIQSLLAESNCTMNSVVKLTVYMTDLKYFSELNQVFTEFFAEPYPTRSTVQVTALPKNALLEIDALAMHA